MNTIEGHILDIKQTQYKRHLFLGAIQSGVANGTLVQVKGRFRVSADTQLKLLQKASRCLRQIKHRKQDPILAEVSTKCSLAQGCIRDEEQASLGEANGWEDLYHQFHEL